MEKITHHTKAIDVNDFENGVVDKYYNIRAKQENFEIKNSCYKKGFYHKDLYPIHEALRGLFTLELNSIHALSDKL